MLTIIGYSLNDTVVVFDRIREYFNNSTSSKYDKELVNSALNSTLSRTVNTSLTTFFVLFIRYYSSISIAAIASTIGIALGTTHGSCLPLPLITDSFPLESMVC